MAFCSQCGSPVSGSFCGACGKPVEPSAGGAGGGPPQPPPSGSELADNLACTLCYIPGAGLIISIIFLAVAPYNQKKRVRFDAWQSILLHAAWFVVTTVVWTLLPWSAAYWLGRLLHLAGVVLLVFLMWQTYQNKKLVLPVIGPFAEKQA